MRRLQVFSAGREKLPPRLLLLSLLGFAACNGEINGPDPAPAPIADGSLPPLASALSIDDGHTVGAVRWGNGDTTAGAIGDPIAGLACEKMNETYHVHSHLSIFLDGHALAVPSNIGIVPTGPTTTCVYSIHTHDASGKIHVEAPVAATFTLGQFFAIWGQPLGWDAIAEFTKLRIAVFITDDGVVSEYTGDLAAIELKSHREITIQIGLPVAQIPNYSWRGQ